MRRGVVIASRPLAARELQEALLRRRNLPLRRLRQGAILGDLLFGGLNQPASPLLMSASVEEPSRTNSQKRTSSRAVSIRAACSSAAVGFGMRA
jgi:hypothetical protein